MKGFTRSIVAGVTGLLLAVGAGIPPVAANHSTWPDGAQWSPSEPVDGVNAPAPIADGCPIESPDGRQLYFASTREDGLDNDIWVAARRKDGTMGTPAMLPAPVNSAAADFCPTPLPGGVLLFVSARAEVDAWGNPPCGAGDIYVTWRIPHTQRWIAPRNLGCAPKGPNTAGMEYSPSLVTTRYGVHLFYSSGAPIGAGTQDIYTVRMRGPFNFGEPKAVSALNTPFDDVMPNISPDGREVVFASARPGGLGGTDIYTARSAGGPLDWTAPSPLSGAVNTSGPETRPSLSWDGRRLYFGRSGDVYVSTR